MNWRVEQATRPMLNRKHWGGNMIRQGTDTTAAIARAGRRCVGDRRARAIAASGQST